MLNYKIKVRMKEPGVALTNRTFLWGGGAIDKDLSSSLFLTVQVEEDSEPIKIYFHRPSAGAGGGDAVEGVGTLEAGEVYSLDLSGLKGVSAELKDNTRPHDSLVACTIHTTH